MLIAAQQIHTFLCESCSCDRDFHPIAMFWNTKQNQVLMREQVSFDAINAFHDSCPAGTLTQFEKAMENDVIVIGCMLNMGLAILEGQ